MREQTEHVAAHVFHPVMLAAVRLVAAPVTAAIGRNHVVALREKIDQPGFAPMVSRVGAEAVNQNDRRALAVLFVMNSHSAGIEEWHPKTSPLVLYFELCKLQEVASIIRRYS